MSRPWMPLYVADYLAGTSHLSTVQHGAYLLLIMHYWRKGGLPGDDEAKLARICRMSPSEWDKARPTLAELFGEGWRHGRINKEIAEADAKYNRRALAGQKGGHATASRQRGSAMGSAMGAGMGAGLGAGKDAGMGAGPDSSQGSGQGSGLMPAALHQPQPQPPSQPQAGQQAGRQAGGAGLDDDELVEWLIAAIGLDAAAGLRNAAPLHQLMQEGFTPEQHFIPVGKRLKAQGRRFRSWAYIMAPVREMAAFRVGPPLSEEARRSLAGFTLGPAEGRTRGFAPGPTEGRTAAAAGERQFVVLDTPEWERRCQALKAAGKLPPTPYYSRELKANGAWLPRQDQPPDAAQGDAAAPDAAAPAASLPIAAGQGFREQEAAPQRPEGHPPTPPTALE